jgi:hypothetical protein
LNLRPLDPQPSAAGPRGFAGVHPCRSTGIRNAGGRSRIVPNRVQWWSKWWSRHAVATSADTAPFTPERRSLSVTMSRRVIPCRVSRPVASAGVWAVIGGPAGRSPTPPRPVKRRALRLAASQRGPHCQGGLGVFANGRCRSFPQVRRIRVARGPPWTTLNTAVSPPAWHHASPA